MLPVSLYFPFLIASSVFSNVYCLSKTHILPHMFSITFISCSDFTSSKNKGLPNCKNKLMKILRQDLDALSLVRTIITSYYFFFISVKPSINCTMVLTKWMCTLFKVLVFNATFNNISAMSWRFIYWWRKAEKTTDLYQVTDKLNHNVVSSTHCHERDSISQL